MKTRHPRFMQAFVAALTVVLVAAADTAVAADFPTKPVQLMIAYPAGGSTDVAARIVAAIADKHCASPRGGEPGGAGSGGLDGHERARPYGYYTRLHHRRRPHRHLYPDRKAHFPVTPLVRTVITMLARRTHTG